jgi:hypothetical protein
MNPVCPRQYQKRITRAGGLNRYGEPNFRLVWSQAETHRAGGVWPHDRYAGYREVYLANGSPYPPRQGYWILLEWTPPEQYGSEAAYYFLHRDDTTGLCNLGPYPHRGRYQIAVKLIWTFFDSDRLVIEPWPLTSTVTDRLIPVILAGRNDSPQRRAEFAEAERLRAERKMESQIEALMHDAKRPLLLPSKIDDRIRLMEKQWAEFLKAPQSLHRGVQQIH